MVLGLIRLIVVGGARRPFAAFLLADWSTTAMMLIVPLAAVALVLVAIAWRRLRRHLEAVELDCAREEFHKQRERLEARFFQLASQSGKPRGLDWTNCEFEDEVVYARDRETGDFTAFVAVSISFAAIEGGGMEDVEAVGNVRAATAVFQRSHRQWITQGRTIFNLAPAEAVDYFQKTLEPVARQSTRRVAD